MIDPKHGGYSQGLASCIGVAVPRARRFWAPSAHRSDAESDNSLVCAARNKTRLAAARTRRRMPSLSSTFVGVCQLGVV